MAVQSWYKQVRESGGLAVFAGAGEVMSRGV
jgi:hypothetical protein